MKQRSGAFGGALAVAALVLTGVLFNVQTARSSDHQDSPTTVAHPAADITDVFLYPAGDAKAANVVLQMNVDPLLTPATAPQAALDPAVLYQFKIAHGATAGPEDMVIQLQASGAGTSQTINVYGPFTPATPGTLATVNTAALAGTVAFGSKVGTPLANGMKVFVGPRADPFFFDLFQFFSFLPDRNYQTAGQSPKPPFSFKFPAPAGPTAGCVQGTPVDALSANNFNVLSVVIEAPRALIAPPSGSQMIHLWTTTSTASGA